MCIVLHLKVYIIHIARKYAKKKVGYWKIKWLRNESLCYTKTYNVIDTSSSLKEEEIHSSHENKLKKVFRKIKPKILASRELYEKFRYILMKLIPKILYWNT